MLKCCSQIDRSIIYKADQIVNPDPENSWCLSDDLVRTDSNLSKRNTIPIPSEVSDELAEDTEDESREEEEDLGSQSIGVTRFRGAVSAENVDFNSAFNPPAYAKSEAQRTKLAGVLAKCFIFTHLSNATLKTIIDAFELRVFPAKTEILKEGDVEEDTNNAIFVLQSGTCDALKKDTREAQIKYKAGDIFGALALLHDNRQPMSIVATSDCSVWSLKRSVFTNLTVRAANDDKIKLMELISSVEIFKDFGPADFSRFVDAMETRVVDVGEKIVVEGEIGDELVIVKQGRCIGVKGSSVVKEYHSKEHFGELSLLYEETNAVSIVAVARTELATLKKKAFIRLIGTKAILQQPIAIDAQLSTQGTEAEIDSHHEFISDGIQQKDRGFEDAEESLSLQWIASNWNCPHYPKKEEQRKLLEAVISKCFIFEAIKADAIEYLVNAFRRQEYTLHEEVISQGASVSANDGGIFVIESGSFAVYRAREGQTESENGSLDDVQPNTCFPARQSVAMKMEQKYGTQIRTYTRSGEYFGELALLYNRTRGASIIAMSNNSAVWYITRDIYENIVGTAKRNEKKRVVAVLSQVPLLNSLSELELSKMAEGLRTENYDKGAHIIRKGDKGMYLYIVETGEAVACNEGTLLKKYCAGDYFGERALVTKKPRAADVIASTKCRVLLVDTPSFARLMSRNKMETITEK